MKKLRVVIFWLAYVPLWIYLKFGTRTRVLVVVDQSVLLLKGRIGLDEWGMPGGGVHHHEEPLNGAVRELKEETGVDLSTSQLNFLYRTEGNQKGLRYTYDCYYARLDKKPALSKQTSEVAKLEWILLKEALTDIADKETNQAVQAWLKHPNLL
jgi:8-oxo-dGTP pyrophosphatase MutT (NUDIX family)